MAKNQVITQWVAKTEDYNRKTRESASILQQFGAKGREAGSLISQFDKILGTNIGTLGKLSVAVGAASSALKVAKDAFFSNEQNVDEWGRTVESAKGIYNGFLNALNTGDFSGFFTNINNIVQAAKDAYNALDELQTKATIIAPSQAKAQAQMLQQKEIIRKKGKDSEEGKAAQQELIRLEGDLKAGYQETAKLNREAFITAVKQKAAEAGVTLTNDMWRSFSDTKAFDRVRAGAQTTSQVTGGWTDTYGVKHETTTQVDNNNMKFIKAFTDEFRKEVSGYLTAEWSAIGSAASTGIADARYLQGGKTGGTGTGKGGGGSTIAQLSGNAEGLDLNLIPDTSIKGVEEKLAEAQALYKIAGDEAGRNYAKAMIEAYSNELEYLKGNNPMMEQINKDFAESLKRSGITKELNDSGKAAKTTSRSVTGAASAFSSLGDAMSNIEDPGAKTAGLIANAIGSVVAGYGAATAQAAQMGPWAWIAFAVAGLATMVATVAQIKQVSAGAYAEGGVVGGNSYYGDKLYARVNSGETILNTQQQQRALAMMDGASMGGGTSTITGEQIVTVINAYGRRTGRGEILK